MLVVVLLTVLSRLLYTEIRGFGAGLAHLYDDALITLRYSRNLAAGLGLVYNQGEPALLGTSSPLYAVLMAIPTRLGFDTIWSSIVFNLACDAAICVLLVRICRGFPTMQVLAPIAFLLHTNILYWSGTGMEFSLLILLTFGTLALFAAKLDAWAGLLAGVALVGRLDAVIVFAGFAAVALLTRRRLPWRFLAGLAVVSLPWYLYAMTTFGSVVPLSARARYLLYASEPFSGNAFSILLNHPWLLPALIGAGLSWIPFGQLTPQLSLFLRSLSLHPLVFLLAYEISGGQIYRRYQVALDASLVILACWAITILLKLHRDTAPAQRTFFAEAGLLVCALLLFRPVLEGLRYPWRTIAPPPNSVHLEVAHWLSSNTPEDAVVMAGNIGYIGYFSHRQIFDSNGLASPEAFLALKAKEPAYHMLDIAKPDFLALDQDEFRALKDHLASRGYRSVFELGYERLPDFRYRIFAHEPVQPTR